MAPLAQLRPRPPLGGGRHRRRVPLDGGTRRRTTGGRRVTTTTIRWTELDSPVGPLLLRGDGDALVALHLDAERDRDEVAATAVRDDVALRDAVEQLTAYFDGRRRDFDDLPLAPVGTAFQHEVWAALRRIPYGETTSYGQLAAELGRPGAARAVGLANGRNPIAIVVPCHRVIGADGTLTGYAGGLERKRSLLALERRHLCAGPEPVQLTL
ncbi:methylated-DNA--[protein]-cysteine S-methyltransferase [Nitriliruptoraceae bacterium ZYF776]|nr:methylated-DNA--[protein]-cysteine S-methyltransferase [Profundirhabdus halotolerans]